MSRGTPHRKVRVPDELWERALARAQAEGTDVSAVLRRALEEWVVSPSTPYEHGTNGTNSVCSSYTEPYNFTGCETCGHALGEHYPPV